jgi:hypothetical protein
MRLLIRLVVSVCLAGVFCSAALAHAGDATGSRITLVHSQSFCTEDPSTAYLYVYVTLTNTGSSRGSVDVRPWRRYSDGGVNDSVLDTFTVKVPAHSTRKVYGKYGYKATDHDLIQCGVYLDSSINLHSLPVVPL